MTSLKTLLPIAGLLSVASSAHAQLVITELQPNVIGDDLGEWIEIQNLGTSSVSIGGYTISDQSGGREVSNFYAFPATASVAPGQVLVVTRQAARYRAIFPTAQLDYELADAMDDMGVPNLTRTGTGAVIQMGNSGDALFLRDAQGTLVSAVEYGNVDLASVPGAPYPTVPNPDSPTTPNASLTRVMRTGSSLVDFTDRFSATPGVGFMTATGPIISNARSTPRHITFGQPYTITASVASTEDLDNVLFYFATATSSTGAAEQEYAEIEPTSTATGSYRYSASVETFWPGYNFGSPADFHSRYLRWFIRAQDAVGAATVDPAGATSDASNTAYRPTYLQNVLPVLPTPIAQAREEGTPAGPRWRGHSVRVRGTAIIGPAVIQPTRLQFALVDASNAGISVFDSALPPGDFDFGPGDVIEVVGTLNDFRGLTQIGQNAEIIVTGEVAPVPTTTLTVAALLAAGNDVESELVHIVGLDFLAARPTWPSDPAASGSWNVTVSDGTGELVLRVTPGATGLFGAAAPQFGFSVTGVVGQFDNTWQLFPRSADDVIAEAAPPIMDAGVSPDAAAPGPDGGSSRADASTAPRADASTNGNGNGNGEDDSGCGCASVAPHGVPSLDVVLGLALLAGLVIARRRRR